MKRQRITRVVYAGAGYVRALCSRICNYSARSRIIGALLILAGLAKLHEFLTVDYDQVSLLFLFYGALEILLGLWLLFGFWPQITRLAMLVLFLAFANVAFSQALSGKASCQCFGRVPVIPWLVFVVDLILVAFLLIAPNLGDRTVDMKKKAPWFGVFAAVVVIATGAAGAFRLVPWGDSSNPQSAYANKILSSVRDAITRNHEAYTSLEFQLKYVVLSPGATGEKKTYKDPKGNVTAIAWTPPRFERSFRYVIRGSDMRRDPIDGTPGRIETVFRGCLLDYDPNSNRAVVSDAGLSLGGDPIDPRCFGFETPVQSVPDWLRRHKLTSIRGYNDEDGEGVEVRAAVTVARGKLSVESDWVVRFSERDNYLPVKIEELHADGARSRLAQFSYQRLPDSSACFLKTLVVKRWSKKPPTNVGQGNPVAIIEYAVERPIPNKPFADSTFDFAIPANASVALSTKKLSSAAVGGGKTFFDLFVNPGEASADVRRSYWPYILGLDMVVLFLAFCIRKYVVL